MVIDKEPNNNFGQAQDLGLISTTTPNHANGSVSNTDVNDVYSFTISNQPHNLSASLFLDTGGVFNDADLMIFRDVNDNKQFDASDHIINSFDQEQGVQKSITLKGLGAGKYFAVVGKDRGPGLSSNSVGYNLSLSAEPGLGKEKESNNIDSNATAIKGNLNGFRKFEGSLSSSTDSVDFYSFNLDTPSDVLEVGVNGPNFDGLSSNVKVSLFYDSNRNNRVDSGELIAKSNNSGTLPESIIREDRAAGKYFVKIESVGNGSTKYELDLLGGTPV